MKNNKVYGENVGGVEMKGNFMQMLGSYTVLRITSMGDMVGIEFTKEELLKMNAALNKIPLPKKRGR